MLLPLASALLYAAAALCVKIALGRGVTTLDILFYSNLVLAAFFLPLAFFGQEHWSATHLPWALLAGALFFLGQVGTFRSLQSGDVSIATPALAAKVVFVALLSLLVPGSRPDPDLWLAVFLTMAGMLLLHGRPATTASRPFVTLAWALFAAFGFAATDIVVQVGAPRAGFTLFMPVMFGTTAALSLPLLIPARRRRGRAVYSPGATTWAAAGIVLLGLQAIGMGTTIGLFGDATGANVVYSSRGLWSVVAVWLIGHWFANTERKMGPRVMLFRLAGALLMTFAIVVTFLG